VVAALLLSDDSETPDRRLQDDFRLAGSQPLPRL